MHVRRDLRSIECTSLVGHTFGNFISIFVKKKKRFCFRCTTRRRAKFNARTPSRPLFVAYKHIIMLMCTCKFNRINLKVSNPIQNTHTHKNCIAARLVFRFSIRFKRTNERNDFINVTLAVHFLGRARIPNMKNHFSFVYFPIMLK